MKLLVLVVVLFACGGPDKQAPSNGSSTAAPKAAEAGLEDVALRWAQAAFGGKRDEVLALSLTHADFIGISNKEITKAEYDEELTGLLDGLAREGKENPGGKVVGTRVADKRTLPAGEKLKREIEIAAVYLVIEKDGKRNDSILPMFFIRADGVWRFTPKK